MCHLVQAGMTKYWSVLDGKLLQISNALDFKNRISQEILETDFRLNPEEHLRLAHRKDVAEQVISRLITEYRHLVGTSAEWC